MDPFDNKQLIADFCYENDLDFDFFIAEKGEDPRFTNRERYELSYCEFNEEEFLKFAEKN